MKALVKAERAPGLTLMHVPEPETGVNDVKIQVRKASICGTDVHIHKWDDWAQKTIPAPMVVGHEFVGHIVETGSNVKGFAEGDVVVGEGHIVCGHCRNCLAGLRHLCSQTLGVGVNRPGAFADYVVIPATNAWHAGDFISEDVLSCFDPLGNATHTALTYDLLGEDVLITGAGPIGCMATAIAQHAGARFVVVTDLNPYRLDLARKMGATLAVDPRTTSLREVMKDLGMREGFDIGLEMSGSPKALDNMVDVMIHGGKIALLGLLPADAPIDWNKVIFNSLNLKGIYGRKMYETWYKTTVMLQGGLDISPVITHHLPYTEFEKGFELMYSGQCGKVVLDWQA